MYGCTMKMLFTVMIVASVFTGGCTYVVTRDEVTDLRSRVTRISSMVKQRRLEEKQLGEAVGKARRELARIMEARDRYRTAQATFITKVRSDLALLRQRLGELETSLARVQKTVDGGLKREADETAAVLKARARELVELETSLSAVAAFNLRHKPEGLLKIIKALADAREWTLLHGYLGIFALKHRGHAQLETALHYALGKLTAGQEFGKVIIYGTLYLRQFPAGTHRADVLFGLGGVYNKLLNCTKALHYFGEFLKAHGDEARAATVREMVKTITGQRHSRQYCAK